MQSKRDKWQFSQIVSFILLFVDMDFILVFHIHFRWRRKMFRQQEEVSGNFYIPNHIRLVVSLVVQLIKNVILKQQTKNLEMEEKIAN